MLNPEDRRAIEGLFDRLSAAEQKAPDREREAVELIEREIARQPAAPYYMAQTILVQQHALEVAERRIEELEQKARENERAMQRRNPWDRQGDVQNGRDDQRGFGGGGGFLGGAMQTALGVAGGVLLGSAIGSLLGAGGANAAEAGANDQPAGDAGNDNVNEQDQGADQDGGGDTGGDWGDFGGGDGGFDMGGDF